MTGIWWQSDACSWRESYITGRKIGCNTDSKRFLLVPERCSLTAIRNAFAECASLWDETDRAVCPSPHLFSILEKTGESAHPRAALGTMLDAIFSAANVWSGGKEVIWKRTNWRRTDKTRIKEVLLSLYRAGLLAFPAQQWHLFTHTNFSVSDFGAAERAASEWINASKSKLAHVVPAVTRMLLSRVEIQSVGDLVPEVMGTDIRDRNIGVALARGLWQAQKTNHGDAVKHHPKDYGLLGRRAPRGREGITFEWARQEDEALSDWCQLAAKFLSERENSKPAWMAGLNGFLDHLLANSSIDRNPASYLVRDTPPQPLFDHSTIQTFNYVVSFLDWVIDTHFSEEGEDGAPVRLYGYANPLKKRGSKPELNETAREAMPTRFVRIALEILTENDWAWARQFRTDRITPDNLNMPTANQIWSPVRAVVLYTMLRMPFRAFQVRTMDSGEADTSIYDVPSHTMVPNKRPVPAVQMGRSVQRGVLQIYGGSNGIPASPIIRLSTNKTADISKEGWERGYDCPYAPEDVVRVLAWLRDWQSAHNALREPTTWSSITEMRTKKTEQELSGLVSCFLFRDASSTHPAAPITHERTWQLWLALLAELERRLEAQGILGSDGSKIILVTAWVKGRPTAVKYDLHTLRVTLITVLYEDGKVPPEVLMKIVGHATVVMTLYYMKLGTAFIADEMSKGDARVQWAEKENWLRHQRNRSFESLRTAVVWNDEVGLQALANGASASLQLMNVGLCPVGASMCERGRKVTPPEGGRPQFVPVPGRRRNCAECRFLISGRPFQGGIQAEFNARSFNLANLTQKRDALETVCETLETQRRTRAAAGELFLEHREWTKSNNDLDDLTAQIDQITREMQNLAILNAQIQHIEANQGPHKDSRDITLIVGDVASVQAAFEETTEFDLADRICQSSVIYPSIVDADANRLRMRKYDQMLRRNGMQPVFLDMDEATALRAGNELSALLSRRAGGRTTALKLIEGDETLVRLGILPKEIFGKLEEVTGERLNAPRTQFLASG